KAFIGPRFVPPIETSYLGPYRSPEPQTAYVVGFLFIGLLLRIVLRHGVAANRSQALVLIVTQVLLMLCYSLICYPLLMIELGAVVILLIERRIRTAVLLGTLAVSSIIAEVIAARVTLGSFNAGVFSSRMPTVTVGMLFSLTMTSVFVA